MSLYMLLADEEIVKAGIRHVLPRGEVMSELEVLIDGAGLSCVEVRWIAQSQALVRVDPAGLHRAAAAHELVRDLAARQPVYGRTNWRPAAPGSAQKCWTLWPRRSTVGSRRRRTPSVPSAPFKLPDRSRQRRLGDAQALGGPAEVPFLGNRDEVRQLAGLQPVHTRRVSGATELVLPRDVATGQV
jgi:hypothetical protein